MTMRVNDACYAVKEHYVNTVKFANMGIIKDNVYVQVYEIKDDNVTFDVTIRMKDGVRYSKITYSHSFMDDLIRTYKLKTI